MPKRVVPGFTSLAALREVAAGNANKVVALRLAVSDETIKAHMRSILSK